MFLRKLISHGLGVPAIIISDRDTWLLSKFWKELFGLRGTKLLAAAAHHPQADGQSERTNQGVEIALRFAIAEHADENSIRYSPKVE